MMWRLAVLLLEIVGVIAACLTLPGSVELLMLSLAALVPSKRRGPATQAGEPWRVAVIVPAHNEELSIGACVQSLLQSARATGAGIATEIFVVADNCTDGTAVAARAAGASVLERTNHELRGKGYALDFAFTQALAMGFQCVIVVDADTRVAENFLAEAAGALRGGAEAVQSRYLVDNPGETIRTRLMGLALRAFNVARPMGRERLGFSAGIFGNGFGLRRETIEAVPYTASSVVEDLEYHLALVRSGRRVLFLNETTVYGEMPVQGRDVKTQRSRWEGGRLRMLFEKSPGLVGDVMRGRLRCVEPLLELLLLPLAFHVLLLLVCVATPLPLVRGFGVAGVAIVLLHLLAAIVAGGGDWHDVTALLAAPFYVAWKLLLIPSLLRSARTEQAWVRTGRNAEAVGESPSSSDRTSEKE